MQLDGIPDFSSIDWLTHDPNPEGRHRTGLVEGEVKGYGQREAVQAGKTLVPPTATLFKQFPTKADLFEAIVVDYWSAGTDGGCTPAPGAPAAGLTSLGRYYAALLLRDGMAGLHRMVIAEGRRFPELGRIQFDLGKVPFFDQVCRYLEAETAQGTLAVDESTMAATQFLGMISNWVLWPRMLLVDWKLPAEQVEKVVESAVATLLARYGAGVGPDRAVAGPQGG